MLKNITFRADANQIERARQIARERNASLTQLFRDWLEGLDDGKELAAKHLAFVRTHSIHHHVGGPYSREEFNRRDFS